MYKFISSAYTWNVLFHVEREIVFIYVLKRNRLSLLVILFFVWYDSQLFKSSLVNVLLIYTTIE